MVCLGAEIILHSADGSRSVAAADFFQGIYDTALEPDELITSIRIPVFAADWRFAFHEIARRHGDFALVGLAFGRQCKGEIVQDCRAVFLGVEAFPRRLIEIEQAFIGTSLNDRGGIEKAVQLLASSLDCLEGGEYPTEYRLYLAQQLLLRCVNEASTRTGTE
jgi:carbon-monoxide dehydrogenase medium subunit